MKITGTPYCGFHPDNSFSLHLLFYFCVPITADLSYVEAKHQDHNLAFNEKKCVNLLFAICSKSIGVGEGCHEWILFPNQVQCRRVQQFHSLSLSDQHSSPASALAPRDPSAFCFTSSPEFKLRSATGPVLALHTTEDTQKGQRLGGDTIHLLIVWNMRFVLVKFPVWI